MCRRAPGSVAAPGGGPLQRVGTRAMLQWRSSGGPRGIGEGNPPGRHRAVTLKRKRAGKASAPASTTTEAQQAAEKAEADRRPSRPANGPASRWPAAEGRAEARPQRRQHEQRRPGRQAQPTSQERREGRQAEAAGRRPSTPGAHPTAQQQDHHHGGQRDQPTATKHRQRTAAKPQGQRRRHQTAKAAGPDAEATKRKRLPSTNACRSKRRRRQVATRGGRATLADQGAP